MVRIRFKAGLGEKIMPRAWDLLPPKPKTKKIIKAQKKRKRIAPFAMAGFIALVAFIFALGVSEQWSLTLPSQTTSSQPSPPLKSNLITKPSPSNPDIKISSSPQISKLSIKILNGSGEPEKTVEVKKILFNAGYEVQTTENALNLYDQTLVYYQDKATEDVNKITELLTNYQATSQKFTQETKFDIVVVIGAE